MNCPGKKDMWNQHIEILLGIYNHYKNYKETME